jgi:hypothetical protein
MMGTGNCKVRREMRKNLGMLVADMRVRSGNDGNWELQSQKGDEEEFGNVSS